MDPQKINSLKLYYTAFWCLLILGAVLFNAACPKEKIPDIIKAAAKAPVGGVVIDTTIRQESPKGIIHTGRNAMTAAQLALADAGIDALNASLEADGFTGPFKPHSFYRLQTPPHPCIPSPIQRVPSFVLNGGHYYDGSEFDQYNPKGKGVKDGISVIFAAEMVLSVGTPGSNPPNGWMYVCPDDSVIENGTRHGGDHIMAANLPYNEKNRKEPPYDGYAYFNCSMYHTAGVNHPLFPRAGRCESSGYQEMLLEVFDAPSESLFGEFKTRGGLIIRPTK